MPKHRSPVTFDPKYFEKQSKQETRKSLKETFTTIYQTNHWEGPDSVSGQGSDLAQTQEIRRQLPILLNDFGIKVILDVPCGDFSWMRLMDSHIQKYIGGDIVEC